MSDIEATITAHVRDIPDYPQPGVLFKDITPLLGDADAFRAGFVPVRKKGKLPAATFAQEYDLEYGSATLEVHQDAFLPGERVLIVDDVLATGGTARATAALIHRAGAHVVGVAVLMELSFLKGREIIPDLEVRSLLVV